MDKRIKNKILSYPNVVGVGVGFKRVKNKRTDEIALIAFVSKKLPIASLSPNEWIPKIVGDKVTDVQELSEVKIQEDPKFYRPAPGGCSVGHFRITAGTLACVVEYKGLVGILSNNHVLANSNEGSIGDRILQPGPHDDGQFPIAKLTEFVPIVLGGGGIPIPSECPIGDFFSDVLNILAQLAGSKTRVIPIKIRSEGEGENLVDAAFAEVWDQDTSLVETEILEIGNLNPNHLTPFLGMKVKKRGRTTELTKGEITAVDVTVDVSGYGGNGIATFVEQVVIEEENEGDFSLGGDSGSLIVTLDNRPIGLLFAGGTDESGRKVTIANDIDNVLTAFPGMIFL